ncbi:serum paraoxonase/arylesterase [Auriscalpium vulgare]|uniref:Serum paraoxonase/arylesterase n=1 Tax=Auriscalpium vulgare TaxID=40419 RepID=A0ACB8RNU3_9AGAM|nr:serum paraoxonase/arylesterase [Auriscalpium vulgare]
MPPAWITATAVLAGLLAAEYQFHVKPLLLNIGAIGRVIENVGNSDCERIPGLTACEELVLHAPTGLLYAVCSTPAGRSHWIPSLDLFSGEDNNHDDVIAFYDPSTSSVTRLDIQGFDSPRGLSTHGFDVVPSSSNPKELFIYAINHREPLHGHAKDVGADSVVEIFKTTLGGKTATHVKTVEDPTIVTPNDVAGSPDGKSFFVTNDHGKKVGHLSRTLELVAGTKKASVAYCHVDTGCKFALSHVRGCNGLAMAPNGTFYLANSKGAEVRVLERHADNSLSITDTIRTDRLIDNVSVDEDGAVWAAGLVDALSFVAAAADPSKITPSSGLRITRNTGESAYFGDKYKVEKAFEDDGNKIPGVTSVVHDSRRGVLYLSGLVTPYVLKCKI